MIVKTSDMMIQLNSDEKIVLKLSCDKILVLKYYLVIKKKLSSDKSQRSEIVKEVIRSDGLWRFACGDVLFG